MFPSVALALVLAGIATLSACSASAPIREVPVLGPEGGPQLLHAREVYHFDDLGEMTATADAVVVASVIAAWPGRLLTYEGGDELQLTEVTLVVNESWSRDPGAATIELEVDSLFAGLPGTPLPGWLRTGSQSVLFLDESDRVGIYHPVNTQGVYRVDQASGDLFATVSGDEFAHEIGRLKIGELRRQIAGLLPRIESGEIERQRTLPLRSGGAP
jgi:hypothetical protein